VELDSALDALSARIALQQAMVEPKVFVLAIAFRVGLRLGDLKSLTVTISTMTRMSLARLEAKNPADGIMCGHRRYCDAFPPKAEDDRKNVALAKTFRNILKYKPEG
jgi:hypothetical protein